MTYRQLEGILKGYGFAFDTPYGNYVHVIRVAARPNLIKAQPLGISVARIGFPGWSTTVAKGELEKTKKILGLGDVDSEDFFSSVDPLERQIEYYREALERLAYR